MSTVRCSPTYWPASTEPLTDPDSSGLYEISSEQSRLDISAIHAYLARSYWSPNIPRDIVERAARNQQCDSETAVGGSSIEVVR